MRAAVLDYLARHPGAGRPLAAEHLARRHRLLGRHPDGRMRLSDPARRHASRAPAHLPSADAARFHADGRDAPPAYVVRNGPVTGEDRWEEDAGYSPVHAGGRDRRPARRRRRCSTLPASTALADYLRETADGWNERDRATGPSPPAPICARQLGVEGYYVRIAPPRHELTRPRRRTALCRSRTGRPATRAGRRRAIVSPDALALVRFGLRAADDPRILDTVKVDRRICCKRDLPHGPCWHRYNGDGYGEHADGAAFDGTGIGPACGRCSPASARITSSPPAAPEAARRCSRH